MRHSFVFLSVLFALLVLACAAAHADAGDAQTEFSAWAARKSGEFDSRWRQATLRHATGEGAGASVGPGAHGPGHSWTPARSARSSAFAGGRAHTGPQFTRRADGQFLNLSTRTRGGATRGVNKLTSPAQATRAFSGERRLPSNNLSKYTGSVNFGRSSTMRPSPRMGSRISSSANASRTPSGLHGATRARRSPTRGR